jgi:ketosteroid isomerase-like protein
MRSRQPTRDVYLIAAIVLLVSFALLSQQAEAFAFRRPMRQHDAKQQIEELEQQWRTCQLSNDVAAMDKMLSDDYIGISMNGSVYTKTQQLDRMRSKKVVLSRLDFDDMKVKMVGSIAIVTSRVEVEGSNEGVPVKGTFRYTRVYKRLPPDGWQITSFEATRVPQSRQPPDGPRAEK